MTDVRFAELTDEKVCDIKGIIFDSRWKVEKVIKQMKDILDAYGVVSVADLCDLIGILGAHNDTKWGWVILEDIEPVKVEDGYMLKLPKAVLIK